MALTNINTADFILGDGVTQDGNVISVAGGGGGGVASVTGDGVDNTDPDNPVLSYPTPGDIGALATGTAWLLASGGTLTADNTLSGAFGIGFGQAPAANNKFRVRGLGTTTGELVNFEDSTGQSRLKILDSGATTFNGNITLQNTNSALTLTGTSSNVRTQFIQGANTSVNLTIWNNATIVLSRLASNPVNNTSGTYTFLNINVGHSPTSGTGNFRIINYSQTINQTGGASGYTHIFNCEPILTSAAAVRGFNYEPTGTGVTGEHSAFYHSAGYIRWNSVLSPAQITSNQNDYNPTGFNNGGAPNGASILRLESDAARDITGLVGGVNGRLLIVANVGAFSITLKNEDAGSTAANRFAFASDFTLNPDQSLTVWYDGVSSRWRTING